MPRKSNLVVHSGKKHTYDEDLKNYHASPEHKALMQEGSKHQKGVQGLADDAVRDAMKEGRGLKTNEIENVIDNLEFGFSHRPAVAAVSKTSSAVKRFTARKNPKTGRMEWVPRR